MRFDFKQLEKAEQDALTWTYNFLYSQMSNWEEDDYQAMRDICDGLRYLIEAPIREVVRETKRPYRREAEIRPIPGAEE